MVIRKGMRYNTCCGIRYIRTAFTQSIINQSTPSENLVGKVILGKKLCDIILSKYSLNIGLSFVLRRSMLKSPSIVHSQFLLLTNSKIGLSSLINV